MQTHTPMLPTNPLPRKPRASNSTLRRYANALGTGCAIGLAGVLPLSHEPVWAGLLTAFAAPTVACAVSAFILSFRRTTNTFGLAATHGATGGLFISACYGLGLLGSNQIACAVIGLAFGIYAGTVLGASLAPDAR